MRFSSENSESLLEDEGHHQDGKGDELSDEAHDA
jgi:hypothetical protein